MIRCANNSLYTGITTDLERRLAEHRDKDGKGAKALRGKGPIEMVWDTEATDRSEASQVEYQIKKLSKSDKERLVLGQYDLEST